MGNEDAIAVGIKDSTQSEAALVWAARRAEQRRVPLTIVHVIDDRWLIEPSAWRDSLKRSGEKLLEAASARIGERFHITVTTELLSGSVAASLGQYARKTSLMVVGSGSPHLGGTLTDRALQIAGASEGPVAVVGATDDYQDRHGVVVGVDGSEHALKAVAFAAAEADRDGQELTVLHAYRAPDPQIDAGLAPAELRRLISDQERLILAETVAGLSVSYPDLPVKKVSEPHKEPVGALVEASANARLLVLGSRGRGGFSRLLLGSTAHGVLTHLTCPTIVIPPEPAADNR
ncbi:universal stress protein [Paenarthrobacter aurescens]|uniref:universal stress protein n=1 Tax=Paenarthrobacter aurescens TaxID=43663 RepID=UPI0021C049CB|nr:universal stress protein [Paenarthrobacter aurescens]MCT9868242.1 universal stress protein [Paenarthrobacter aurescens]